MTTAEPLMTVEEAVQWMRERPEYADLIEDAYLSSNVVEAAERFRASAEFDAVLRLLGPRLAGATVGDVGAGNGIASWAFAQSGARVVYAVDPSDSAVIGLGALRSMPGSETIVPLTGVGEELPLESATCDIVYVRQTLHHADSLERFLTEIARVLKAGGVLLATREHVAETPEELATFLANHPTHRLVGGEHAFPLRAYIRAIESAGLVIDSVLGPWDSVINAYPAVRNEGELHSVAELALEKRLGRIGRLVARVPGCAGIVDRYIRRHRAGDLVTFIALKPSPLPPRA